MKFVNLCFNLETRIILKINKRENCILCCIVLVCYNLIREIIYIFKISLILTQRII